MQTQRHLSQPARPATRYQAVAGPGEGALRERVRRYAAAWLLGAAVVVWPAWPTAAQERAARRPGFERALSWRDFIRLRLSPWLLMQDVEQYGSHGEHGPPTTI